MVLWLTDTTQKKRGLTSIETKRISLSELQGELYYQLYKFIVHDKAFKNLSSDAKILYSVMRDRHKLSLENNWVDDEGNVFIYYSRESMGEDVNKSSKTITKAVNELKKYNLVEEVRQGVNKPNRIYIMSVAVDSQWTCKNYASRPVKITHLEGEKVHDNKNNINKTNKNKDICSSDDEAITQIILYLNEKCRTSFRTNGKENRKYIAARLKESFTVNQCKQVIDIKAKEWLDDEKFGKNLNPTTLFRPSNFERYLNQNPVSNRVVAEQPENEFYVTPTGVQTKYTRDYIMSDLVETRLEDGKTVYYGVDPNNLSGGYRRLDI
ncbi:MAG: conserved phage C-terminal domain-containing protein [Sarcina sp.]